MHGSVVSRNPSKLEGAPEGQACRGASLRPVPRAPDTRHVITTVVVIERKDDSLPAFVVLPEELLAPWSLSGTTMVEVTVESTDLGRRSLKHWPQRSGWFMNLTAPQMAAASLGVGDRVRLTVKRASTEIPPELSGLLAEEPEASERWERLSEARRRAVCEHVREAKRAATRETRARKALGLGPAPSRIREC